MRLIVRNVKQAGAGLCRFRRKKQMTQSELGERANLRQAAISRVENGEPGTRLQTFFAVLTALDLEIVIHPRTKKSAKDIEDIF